MHDLQNTKLTQELRDTQMYLLDWLFETPPLPPPPKYEGSIIIPHTPIGPYLLYVYLPSSGSGGHFALQPLLIVLTCLSGLPSISIDNWPIC